MQVLLPLNKQLLIVPCRNFGSRFPPTAFKKTICISFRLSCLLQALHLKLRDTHEAAIFHLSKRNRATQSVASVDSRMPMYGSTSISGLGSQALRSRHLLESRLGCMDSQNSGAFANSRSSQNFGKAAGLPGCLEGAEDLKSPESSGSSAGFAGRLVRRARKANDKIDDKIEADAWT